MANSGAILRVQRLKGARGILVAAKHNKRAIQAEMGAGGNIDAALCHLNESIAGPSTPDEVAAKAEMMMAQAGIVSLRKDAVRALEFVVSLPADTCINVRDFFVAVVAWLIARFGAENVLSADIHRDEAAPHMHALVLPLIDGRMIGSSIFGTRATLMKTQEEFFQAVCKPYGLNRHAKVSGAAKAGLVAAVLAELRAMHDPALKSALWPILRSQIEAEPSAAADALGVTAAAAVKAKKTKTMTDIFISKGKGPAKVDPQDKPIGFVVRHEAIADPKPIGFDAPGEGQNLSCVGFSPATQAATQALPAPKSAAVMGVRMAWVIRRRLLASAAFPVAARIERRPAAYYTARIAIQAAIVANLSEVSL